MPEPNENKLNMFIDAISYKDNDKKIIKSIHTEFADEIKLLKDKGEDLLDKVNDIISPQKTDYGTTPVITQDRIENGLMSTSADAVNTVFQPRTPVVEKKSAFFDDVKYKIRGTELSAYKKLNKSTNLNTKVDFFDKTIELNIKKSPEGSSSYLSTGAGYNPFSNTLKLNVSYSEPLVSFTGRAYLRENNPGISGNCNYKINKNSSLNINAAAFKSDMAFDMEYNKKLDTQRTFSIGAYGSTQYKEVGIYARIGY